MGNVDAARQAIRYAVKELSQNKDLKSESWNKLKDALFTRPELVPKKTRSDLALLTDKYWGHLMGPTVQVHQDEVLLWV